jgi:hypothetical protein
MPTSPSTGAEPVPILPPRYVDEDNPLFRPRYGFTTATATARSTTTITTSDGTRQYASAPTSRRGSSTRTLEDGRSSAGEIAIAKPTLLQPRVAAVLGVPKVWQKALFACRLLSIAPSIWWGFPNGLRFLALLHRLFVHRTSDVAWQEDTRLRLVETSLATMWCAAAAYLSFFFTDSLMSRWLVNYTPQATVVRLLTINALNAYLTSWVLYLSGGSEDAHLLLPAWIAIATVRMIDPSHFPSHTFLVTYTLVEGFDTNQTLWLGIDLDSHLPHHTA